MRSILAPKYERSRRGLVSDPPAQVPAPDQHDRRQQVEADQPAHSGRARFVRTLAHAALSCGSGSFVVEYGGRYFMIGPYSAFCS